jgi:hypothetical protein
MRMADLSRFFDDKDSEVDLPTPHLDKLKAALTNPKCKPEDVKVLKEAVGLYDEWTKRASKVNSKGNGRVEELVRLLNWYKDKLEVDLIMGSGSSFLKRQKGQLKLDNSVLEEFLVTLIDPRIIDGLENLDKLAIGPHEAFMSLAFIPKSLKDLTSRPNVVVKTKDQDFVIGTRIHYRFSADEHFSQKTTAEGSLTLAVLAAECKVNLDKTMFQEAAGTAGRLKQGCPMAKYFMLVEYLDMEPEDPRLTSIDNVYLLRHVRRLPFEMRNDLDEVASQHKKHPIDSKIIVKFVDDVRSFVGATWYDPDKVLEKGSFV